MSTHELQDQVKELRELKRMQEELAAEITAIEDSIKAVMTERGAAELVAGEYKIRWTEVTSSRLDSKALKTALPDVYDSFTREIRYRRIRAGFIRISASVMKAADA